MARYRAVMPNRTRGGQGCGARSLFTLCDARRRFQEEQDFAATAFVVTVVVGSGFRGRGDGVIVVSLILGFATRLGAVLALGFVAIAVLTAHLYWQYPAAQQPLRWAVLSKDIAIAGDILIMFATGAAATASMRN